jgi:hypothetical protein
MWIYAGIFDFVTWFILYGQPPLAVERVSLLLSSFFSPSKKNIHLPEWKRDYDFLTGIHFFIRITNVQYVM